MTTDENLDKGLSLARGADHDRRQARDSTSVVDGTTGNTEPCYDVAVVMVCPAAEHLAEYVFGSLANEDRQAIERHIDACSSCRRAVSTLAETFESHPDCSGTAHTREPGSTVEIAPGARVGRYIVLNVAGMGAMGKVFAAYDPELDRRVALEILHPVSASLDGQRGRNRRLLREARAMAKLSHPNLVAVHDVGLDGDRLFIAMEYVDGETLRTWLDSGTRSSQEVVQVLLAAGRGLAAAHEAGVVHRDFKPENVIIARDGRVQVTNFGLARPYHQRAEERSPDSSGTSSNTTPTQPIETAGTTAYMAPEQRRGERADERSDQFSFCVAAFEGLSGARPFAGDTLDALAKNGFDAKPRPFHAPISASQKAAVLRGLSADSAQRFPSLADLLEALGGDSGRRRRGMLVAVSCVVVVAGLVLAALFGSRDPGVCAAAGAEVDEVWNQESRDSLARSFDATGRKNAPGTTQRVVSALERYAARWRQMRADVCQATHVRRAQSAELLDLRMICLDRRLEELRALLVVFSADVDGEMLARAVEAAATLSRIEDCGDRAALARVLPLPPDAETRRQIEAHGASTSLARVLRQAGRFDEGLKLASDTLTAARQIGYVPLVAETLFERGYLLAEKGEYEAAMTAYQEVVQLSAASGDDSLAARAWTQLLLVGGNRQRQHDKVAGWLLGARAAVARAGNPPELLGELEHAYAAVLHSQGDYAGARDRFLAARRLMDSVSEPCVPCVAHAIHSAGGAALKLREFEEAEPLLYQGLEMLESALGSHHPTVIKALEPLGALLAHRGRRDEATQVFERVLAHGEQVEDHRMVARALSNLGILATLQWKHEAALEYLNRAIALMEEELGPDHPNLAATLYHAGQAYLGLGELELASTHASRALEIYERTFGEDHPDLVGALVLLGRTALAMGDVDSARRHGHRALALVEAHRGEDSAQLARVLPYVGDVYFQQGDYEEARTHYDRALRIARASHGPTNPLVVGMLHKKGLVFEKQGRWLEALPHFEQAAEASEVFADNPQKQAQVLGSLGICLVAVDRKSDAIEPLERALALHERAETKACSDLADLKLGLARALEARKAERARAVRLVRLAYREYDAVGDAAGKARAAAWLTEQGAVERDLQ